MNPLQIEHNLSKTFCMHHQNLDCPSKYSDDGGLHAAAAGSQAYDSTLLPDGPIVEYRGR